jgi:hypothetical protein
MMGTEQNNGWAMEEFSNVELGEKRLNKRFIKLCDSLSESPESPINQACADWAETKAAYRFFKNEHVDVDKILEAHSTKTSERVGRHRAVLAIQDTSYLVDTSPRRTTGLGKLTLKTGKRVKKIYSQGLLMHSCLAVTTEGLPLGLWDHKIFARQAVSTDSHPPRDTTPIEEKESDRWLESLQHSTPLCGDTQVVTVCDRQADLYEVFRLSAEIGAPVLVRANYDRPVNQRSMYAERDVVKLWDHLEKQPCAGSCMVEIPARKGTKHATERESRIATLEVRFGSFKLNPPKRLSSKFPDLERSAIYGLEKNPPAEVQPVEWMLLTNLTINNFDQASEKIQWYCLRWRIEMYHKVLKSGFNVEQCRLGDAERLIRYLTVMSIIAWRLFMITLIARTSPDTPCSTLLTEGEWKVLYLKVNKTQPLPSSVPSIRDVVIGIARLGGFLARNNDGHPGPMTLWRGWKRLTDLTDGWYLARPEDICG